MKLDFSPDHMAFIGAALAARDEELRLDPNDIEARYNKALMLLSIGEFTEGWALFDARLAMPDSVFRYEWFPVPRWDGGAIDAKHVLVWLDQGIGDQIMSMAFLARLADRCASVTLMADRRFAPLCRRSFPTIEFYRTGDRVPDRLRTWDFDCQLSASDLGRMFLATGDDFNSAPYLKPDPEKVAAIRRRYIDKTNPRPLVGFSWVSQKPTYGILKSIAPNEFSKLLEHKSFQFVSLQYGDHDADMAAFRAIGSEFIVDPDIDGLANLDDWAAQIAAMDMIVTVSNSVVHFAGAMGVKTAAMVPVGHGRVWYWFTGHDQSPWYDSVNIIHAQAPDDWSQSLETAWFKLYSFAISGATKCLIA